MILKIKKIIKEQIKKIIMEEDNFSYVSPIDTKAIEDLFSKKNIDFQTQKIVLKNVLKDEILANWVAENLKNFEEYKKFKFNIFEYYQFHDPIEIRLWNNKFGSFIKWGLNSKNKIAAMKFNPEFIKFLTICQDTFNSETFKKQQFLNLNKSNTRELDTYSDGIILNPIRSFLESMNYNVLVKGFPKQKLDIFNFDENQKVISEDQWKQNVLKIKEKIKNINFIELNSTYSFLGDKNTSSLKKQTYKIKDSIEGHEFKFLDVPIKFDDKLFPIKKVIETSNIIDKDTLINDINKIAEYGPVDGLDVFSGKPNRTKNSFALSLILILNCLDPKKNIAIVYRYNGKLYLVNNFNSSRVEWEYNPESAKNFKPW